MSEELLSAMLDGECTPAEIEAALAAIERSPALKARWSRMCLTRDALAGVTIAKPAFDLTASIMAALDEAPEAVLSPKVVPLRPRAVAPTPTPVPAAAVSVRSLRWQRFAGLAVAASITAVVAIGGRNLLDQPIDAGVAVQQTADAGIAAGGLVKVIADGQNTGAVPVQVASEETPIWDDLDAVSKRQLTEYLIEHSTHGAEAGVGGPLGYTRIAAQQASYRPADGSR